MTRPLLIWHPPPHPTESLAGYVLRLSEGNGYLSPWSIYSLAGMKQSEMRTCGFKLEKLAAVINRPVSELEPIGFSAPTDQPRCARLLGQSLVPTDLNVTTPGLCPKCVAEKGFIEAQWHLTLMAGCPDHQCRPARLCPKCGKQLRLFRQGLLECACGGSLVECDLPSISNMEAALLDIIRCNALGILADGENPLALPREQLLAMNLRSMLMVIRTLGRHRLIADGNTAVEDEFQIVSAAANVLHQWPNNFIALLKDIGKGIEANGEGGVRKQFAGIFHGLFKNRAINPREQADFLRVAFLEFAENDWDRGFVDYKLLQQVRGRVEKRFITQSDLAAKTGVAPVTVSRWIKNLSLPSRRVRCGKSTRILVESSQSTIPRTTAGKTYWEREAAKRMGLSVGVLRSLKDSGIFEFNHLLPTKGGYHELDMDAFTEKLLALAPPHMLVGNHSSECISLKTALNGRHDSLETKLELVRALLVGDLVIAGNMDMTIGGLLINRAEYRRYVISVRIRDAEDTMLPHVVGKYLYCDASTIPGLVRMGLLDSHKTRTCMRITNRSAEAFEKEYVSLASIAKGIGTASSRGLMRCCNENGIQLLLVPKTRRSGQQPFIRLSDRARLTEARANKAISARVRN